jgi:hypothetical protein
VQCDFFYVYFRLFPLIPRIWTMRMKMLIKSSSR